MDYKLGSLFDGSGGFPLAGSLCGVDPVWAAEIEPYPIAVTSNRFPKMRHLGDISKVKGWEIEPVDIITFGSPCQDLSEAGKRAGLKHEGKGDEETTRSGLFIEAVRIIKEMREATNGQYPAFALWENVPGAFSSNKGEDFRTVLEELIRIPEPDAVMPPVPKAGWAYADSYCGDGWSLAYRVFDAQYRGVPQRRRRIHLIVDFRGECAREVLFEREGVRGYFAPCRTPGQGASQNAEGCPGATGCVSVLRSAGFDYQAGGLPKCSIKYMPERVTTMKAGGVHAVVYAVENHPADSRVQINESGKCQTLTSRMGTGGGNVPLVLSQESDTARVWYIVRRLAPIECARLQGFPDLWGHFEKKDNLTPEEYRFWLDVRNTHANINGKKVREYTPAQILKWYNGLHKDGPEYKMWGNGIALPPALYCLQGMVDVLSREAEDDWMN